jgi:hypothetical protein
MRASWGERGREDELSTRWKASSAGRRSGGVGGRGRNVERRGGSGVLNRRIRDGFFFFERDEVRTGRR